MNLHFPEVDCSAYKSPVQIARVRTEAWALHNLYCPACERPRLAQAPNNTKGIDFTCDRCNEGYQLKSGKSLPKYRIVDAAYGAMIAAIRSEQAPNLFYMHYGADQVHNLLLVPRFFFTEQCIEARKPLSPTARRAGWIGCNIRVDRISPEGKIAVVDKGTIVPTSTVREQVRKLAPIKSIPPRLRGWALAVLLEIHRLGKQDFTLAEIYAAEHRLAAQFPGNKNVRPKIRQQLQILRDLGILVFTSPGRYRLF
jgi:type II restriction enzyme